MDKLIDIEKQYKEKVIKIWDKFSDIPILNEPGCEYRKSPVLPKTVECDSVMFIGCNPSFRNGAKIDNNIEFYSKIENEKDIPYFEKIKEVVAYCNNVSWSHLDMCFIRETIQKIIEELTYTNIDFIQAQLDISFEIIEKSKPKLIVVTNALASEFFGKKKNKHKGLETIWKGYNLDFNNDFDNEIGTYKIEIDGKITPIIFSGMLSGQRTLDIGSFERLKWQIKMILDRIE
jgi:hypothetical protein